MEKLVMVLSSSKPNKWDSSHGEINVRIMRYAGTYLHTGDNLINGYLFDDFRIRAWFSQEYPELNFGNMYDSIGYSEVYSVDLQKAESMVKTLKKVHSSMEKKERVSIAENYGEYILRVAKIFGIKEFKFLKEVGHWPVPPVWGTIEATDLNQWIEDQRKKNLE